MESLRSLFTALARSILCRIEEILINKVSNTFFFHKCSSRVLERGSIRNARRTSVIFGQKTDADDNDDDTNGGNKSFVVIAKYIINV